jgi:hypothetical protein
VCVCVVCLWCGVCGVCACVVYVWSVCGVVCVYVCVMWCVCMCVQELVVIQGALCVYCNNIICVLIIRGTLEINWFVCENLARKSTSKGVVANRSKYL